MKKNPKTTNLAILRKQAEKKLAKQTERLLKLSGKDVELLVHELGTHQIELEMQNEELRRAQEELEASRSRYADLYDFAPVGYFTFNGQALILEANLTAARELGLERGRIIKQPFRVFVITKDRTIFDAHLREVFQSESRQTCEVRLKRKSGIEFYARLESILVQDLNGNNVCRTSLIDITENKKTETLLKEERDFISAVLSTEGALVVVLDLQGRIVSFNKTCELITGYSFDEVKGTPLWDFLLIPEEVKPVKSVFKELKAGQYPNKNENYWVTKDGRHRFISWSNTSLLDSNGNVKYVIGTGIDITERKRAEDEIKRFASFPQLNPNPVLEVDSSGIIVFSNDAAVLTLRKLDIGDIHVFLPDDIAHILTALEQEKEEQFYREVKIKDRIFGEVLYPTPQFDSIRIYANDITERKAYQDALKNALLESRQHEEAVRSERQKLTNILDSMQDGVYIVNQQNEIEYVNPLLEKEYGPVNGRKCHEYFEGRKKACTWCKNQEVFKGKTVRWEWYSEKTNKTYDLINTPLRNPDGNVSKLGIFRDITERKQAEQDLQHSERRYRSFVDVTSQFAWVTDAAGQVVEDIPALRAFTGQTYEQAKGAGWADALHPEDVQHTFEVWNRAVSTRTLYETEYRMRRHDGVYRLLLARGVPVLNEQGNVVEWVGTCIDITDRKRAEEKLCKESSEIAFANRILQVFVTETGDDLFDKVLNIVLQTTASRHGVFGYIAEPGHLICPSLSKMLDVCEVKGKCIHYPPEKWKGLWARALKEKRSLFTKEAPPVPPGHPIINCNLAVPILFQGEPIGLLNLANKEGGYTENDQEMLDGIAARMAPVLYAWIQHKLREDERKQAEEALRQSQQDLDRAQEVGQIGSWRMDVRHNVLTWSDENHRIFGLPKGTPMTYETFLSIVHPDDREYVDKKWKAGLVGENYDIEHRIIVNAKTKWVREKAYLEFDKNGELLGGFGITQDITERKRIEEELRKSRGELEIRVQERTAELKEAQDRMKATNDILSLFITKSTKKEYLDSVVDLIHKWTDCKCVGIKVLDKLGNIPYESYTGFSREFWEAENWISVKNHQCACIRVVLQKPYPQDVGMMTANGSFYCNNTETFAGMLSEKELSKYRGLCIRTGFKSVAIIPILYKEAVLGALHIADKREGMVQLEKVEFIESVIPLMGEAIFRFSAEDALEKSEERYRILVETMNEGLGMDDENGLLVYANERLCEMLDYSQEEIIGRPVLSFFDEKNQNILKEQIEKRRRGENEPYRIEWMGKDGKKIITVLSPKGIFDSNGDYEGSFAVITDITERLRLESIAEAVNTMENIGFIFSGVRHEIGNPVNSIKMALSVLKQNIDSYSTDKIKEYADRMLEEISRMEYLLKAMKSFNMYETVELIDTDMTDFMNKFLSLVKEDFEKKGIKVESSVSDSSWVYADPRALQQVLLNILTNASDSLEGRQDPRITINVSKMADMVNIRVEDNGNGMTEDQQEDLFKPFYTTKSKGTGLGLVISKKMMTKMKGFIEVVSEKDKGTIVDLYIPEGISE